MSRTVTIDGSSYTLPTGSDGNWSADFTRLMLALIDAVNGVVSAAHPAGILYFGAQAIVSASTSFLYPGYYDAAAATLGVDIQVVIPRSGSLSRLYARHTAANTSQAVVYTVRVNGVDSALACTITGGTSNANDTADTVSVNAGDRVSISVQAPSTSPVLILPAASVLFTPADS